MTVCWRRKMRIKMFVLVFLMLGCAQDLLADSLYPVEGTGSIYTEKRARRVGDVITVLIQELSQATNSASNNNQKNATMHIGAGLGFLGTQILNTDNQVGVGSRSDYQGQGASSRSSKITGQMTAKITSVLPSGNYVVEGTRYVEVNEEKQLIEVTGEIRPDDISTDNTVLSTRVANARIKFTGTGPASETAKPGLLTRVMSWLGLF
jgi:flagellar L-ring protein FlgH